MPPLMVLPPMTTTLPRQPNPLQPTTNPNPSPFPLQQLKCLLPLLLQQPPLTRMRTRTTRLVMMSIPKQRFPLPHRLLQLHLHLQTNVQVNFESVKLRNPLRFLLQLQLQAHQLFQACYLLLSHLHPPVRRRPPPKWTHVVIPKDVL